MNPMLEVKDLSVSIGDKQILRDITVSIYPGKPAVLFGPNGSGKSTLIKAILGFEGYRIDKGEIVFKGTKLNGLPTDERVKLGMGIMFQNPPKIRGVTLSEIANFFTRDAGKIEAAAQRLSLTAFLKRDVNLGFSGGEMKRSELFQVLMQDPELILLDEPESGVDMENISLMGQVLSEFLARPGKSALMITHTGYILDFVKSENGCVMIGGQLWCVGDPKEMFASIKKSGYEKCKECSHVQGAFK